MVHGVLNWFALASSAKCTFHRPTYWACHCRMIVFLVDLQIQRNFFIKWIGNFIGSISKKVESIYKKTYRIYHIFDGFFSNLQIITNLKNHVVVSIRRNEYPYLRNRFLETKLFCNCKKSHLLALQHNQPPTLKMGL